MISALHPRFARTRPRIRPETPESGRRAIDPVHFRSTMGGYPTGVAVVTTMHDGQPAGMTVGTFTSISIDPPLVGFFADQGSRTLPKIVESGTFAVNVLDAPNKAVCDGFSRPSTDKFAGVEWTPTATGSPGLAAASLWVDCHLDEVISVGDHILVVGRVESLDRNPAGADPLIFHGGRFHTLTALA
ncbi:flavin reductase family protein [Rhodococcus hoagii]|nr:flavin reductase family protein [Prescottella equi]